MFIKLTMFSEKNAFVRVNDDKIESYSPITDPFGKPYSIVKLASGAVEPVKETVEEIDKKLGSLVERRV